MLDHFACACLVHHTLSLTIFALLASCSEYMCLCTYIIRNSFSCLASCGECVCVCCVHISSLTILLLRLRRLCAVYIHHLLASCGDVCVYCIYVNTPSLTILLVCMVFLCTCIILNQQTPLYVLHRVMLCARCPVFRQMFAALMQEKHSDRIHLADTAPAVVRALLKFIYSGTLAHGAPGSARDVTSWQQSADLFCLADKYSLPSLAHLCVHAMRAFMTPQKLAGHSAAGQAARRTSRCTGTILDGARVLGVPL